VIGGRGGAAQARFAPFAPSFGVRSNTWAAGYVGGEMVGHDFLYSVHFTIRTAQTCSTTGMV